MSSLVRLGSPRRGGTSAPHPTPESSPRKLGIEPLEHRELLASGLSGIPGLVDTPAARYVTGLYYDALHRVPLAGEVTGWIAALSAEQGHGRVAQRILDSIESRTNFIQDTYSSLLGRTPARAEVELWLHGLDAGLGDAQFQVGFLTAQEYATRQANNSRDWLTGLYQDTLGRAPDAPGLAAWNQALAQGQSRAEVALRIVTSAEAQARVVAAVYQHFLGRDPDAVGQASFVAALGRGMTTVQLQIAITSSPEYIALQDAQAASPVSGDARTTRPLQFDFGSPTSPLEPGYTPVPLVSYSSTWGFGWANVQGMLWRNRAIGDSLTRDLHLGKDATFRADLPNGTYNLTVTLGDAIYPRWGMSLWAEGNPLASGLATAAGQSLRSTYQVTVTDGRLDLRLTGSANDYFALTAIALSPVSPPPALSLAVDAGPDVGTDEGSTVSFAAAAATGAGSLSFSWDFGDGTGATTLQASHTYTDNGTYTATLTVTDSSGATKQDRVIVVVRDVAPTVRAGNGYAGLKGSPITFAATVTDPSVTDTTAGFLYTWDFGDGSTSSLSTPMHRYAQPGVYTVTLVVTDKDGVSTRTTTTATVTSPPDGDDLHTPHDEVPHFGANPTIQSIASGAWSDVQTWSAGRVPAAGDEVAITTSTTVTYDVVSDVNLKTVAIEAGGQLQFRTDTNTRIVVGDFLVHEGGELQVGTDANPIRADVTASILIADLAIDLAVDPQQMGTGLIVLGKISIAGAPKTPTFVRLAVEPRAGATSLIVEQPVSGWRPGDKLALPDTRQLRTDQTGANYDAQLEELTLASVSADGRVLTLSSPLQFDHLGARNADGVLEFLPHVNNLTRNVVLESANPLGTRGHTMFLHRAEVDIRYAAFRMLGRTQNETLDNTTFDDAGQVTHIGTNQAGRYPVHFHHVMGPVVEPANGYQFTLLGNAVDGVSIYYGNPKWGIALHDSHYGLVQDNVLFKTKGAGLAAEDGSESFNVIQHNSVIRVYGIGGRADRDGDPLNTGREGTGFWFRGPNNYVRDNVVSNVFSDTITNYGYIYSFVHLGAARIPAFQGADTDEPGQYLAVNMNAAPLLQFEGNEAYGAMQSGLTVWWLGTTGTSPHLDTPASVIKNSRVWNMTYYGMFLYENYHLTLDGLVVRGDGGVGVYLGDYLAKDLVIRNADVQGMDVGIGVTPLTGGGTQTIENSYLRNQVDIAIPNLWTSDFTADNLPPRKVLIRNVKFDTRPLPSRPEQTRYTIRLDWDAISGRNLIQQDEIYVYDYNQVPGDDFRLYYVQQDPNYVVPQTVYNADETAQMRAAPEAGLTNQQAWEQYQIAIASAVAPSTAQARAEIGYGLVAQI